MVTCAIAPKVVRTRHPIHRSEPRPLLLLSVQGNTPEAKQAARLSNLLKWPGKPGLEALVDEHVP